MAKNEKKSFWKVLGNFFKKIWISICGFCVRTGHELKRMRWPSKKALINATYIVLSFVFVFGVYIILDDFIIAQIFRLIY